jgi:hypothetical protein
MITEVAITQMGWTRSSRGPETLEEVLHRPFGMTRGRKEHVMVF